jgi:hypothetical protein
MDNLTYFIFLNMPATRPLSFTPGLSDSMQGPQVLVIEGKVLKDGTSFMRPGFKGRHVLYEARF